MITLRVVALTEDGARDGTQVILRIVRSILRLIDPEVQTHRIAWEPYEDAQRPAVVANAWLSGSPRDQKKVTELNRYLARVLTEVGPTRMVVHHFDADEPWQGGEARRLRLWTTTVRDPVGRLAGDAVRALVPMVPHPEIEAWLYLRRDELLRLAVTEGQVAPVPPATGWDRTRGVKDEHDWPKDKHNLALAQRLSAPEAAAVSPSFAASIRRIGDVPGLPEALAATRSR